MKSLITFILLIGFAMLLVAIDVELHFGVLVATIFLTQFIGLLAFNDLPDRNPIAKTTARDRLIKKMKGQRIDSPYTYRG